MSVLGPDATVDQKITVPNSNLAFGSLIRCSVSRVDIKASEKKGERVYSCTGPLITRSFSEIPQVISKCAQRHLLNLPASVKTVFLLGNGDAYAKECQQLLRNLFPLNYRAINPMAVEAGGKR